MARPPCIWPACGRSEVCPGKVVLGQNQPSGRLGLPVGEWETKLELIWTWPVPEVMSNWGVRALVSLRLLAQPSFRSPRFIPRDSESSCLSFAFCSWELCRPVFPYTSPRSSVVNIGPPDGALLASGIFFPTLTLLER